MHHSHGAFCGSLPRPHRRRPLTYTEMLQPVTPAEADESGIELAAWAAGKEAVLLAGRGASVREIREGVAQAVLRAYRDRAG